MQLTLKQLAELETNDSALSGDILLTIPPGTSIVCRAFREWIRQMNKQE